MASGQWAQLFSFPAIYVYTHDSIGLGEDGPTHQGASAPAPRIYQEFGLTVENVVRRAKELLG